MPKKIVYKLDNSKKVYTRIDLQEMGYERYAIDQMVQKEMLIKITGSVFENHNYDGAESDFYFIPALIKEGIVCMFSAAVYYGLSNYWPEQIDVAVRKDKKIVTLPKRPPINIYHFGKDRYELGVVTINDNGNCFKIYDIEKTVVDIIYFRNQVGIEETKEILINYLNRKDRNINKLYMYAEKTNCLKILKTYMEVLIWVNVASIKDRLKNISNKTGKTFQDLLIAYGLERTIYRISISKYKRRFILKGGIFLYALNKGNYSRVTSDIDLLAQNISNDVKNMNRIFFEIFSIECDDALKYDVDSLRIKSITEFKKYHGINVSINTYLDKTIIPISIDIGFGDIIYPEVVKMDFPALLGNEIPNIYAYSIYSVIAEKFEAFVSLGLANSRYKDFYDIYCLAIEYDLDGDILKEAIAETFNHRQTQINEIGAFKDSYTNDAVNQQRWNSFIKKKKTINRISLNETISVIKELIMPIVDSIENNTSFNCKWSKDKRIWL